jgi:hypothetical protein
MAQIPALVVPALGATRIAIGVGLLVNPAGLGRALGLDEETAQRAGWLGRLTGAREIAIGLGTLQAWRRGDRVDGWIAAQAISDGSDAIAFSVVAVRGEVSPTRGWGMAAFAASGAISEVLTALALRTVSPGELPRPSSGSTAAPQ